MIQANRVSFSKRTKHDYEVADAVNGLSQQRLRELDAWASLADLSSNTTLDYVDANLDSIIFSGSRFELVADVHVTLNYPEDTSFSDSYGAIVEGQMEEGRITIQRVTIDVSTFYE